MGKSKAALPDLTKVIELKMDFTAVSVSKHFVQGILRGHGRGNLFLKVRTSMLGIAGRNENSCVRNGVLVNQRNSESLKSRVCIKEEQWHNRWLYRSLAVLLTL